MCVSLAKLPFVINRMYVSLAEWVICLECESILTYLIDVLSEQSYVLGDQNI